MYSSHAFLEKNTMYATGNYSFLKPIYESEDILSILFHLVAAVVDCPRVNIDINHSRPLMSRQFRSEIMSDLASNEASTARTKVSRSRTGIFSEHTHAVEWHHVVRFSRVNYLTVIRGLNFLIIISPKSRKANYTYRLGPRLTTITINAR